MQLISKIMQKYQSDPSHTQLVRHFFFSSSHINDPQREVLARRPFSQLMAVDVIFEHGLLHVVTDHRTERADSVALLVLLKLLAGYEREALLAVTTHQRLPGTEIEAAAAAAHEEW